MPLIALILAGCVKHPESGPNVDPDANDFTFTTTQTVALNIDYGVSAVAPFSVYDRNPVIENGSGGLMLDPTLEPLAAGFTDQDGCYRAGEISLPGYVTKIWIYSPAYYMATLLEAAIESGRAVAQAPHSVPMAARSRSTSSLENKPVLNGWKTWLGEFDSRTGAPDYLAGYSDPLRVNIFTAWKLYLASASVIKVDQSCPEVYRNTKDMLVTEDAQVAVTMLGSRTCWNNSLGYFYYPADQVPASLDQVHVIMLFPNCQDGSWYQNGLRAVNPGLDRGDAVRLMYYPHIAENSMEGATDVFPKGMKIGFVLATNGWTSDKSSGFTDYGWKLGTRFYACSTPGLSTPNNANGLDGHMASYTYNEKYTIFSFEDYRDDTNFSDVVFTIVSNPVGAIDSGADVDPSDMTTSAASTGIYAFEDLWPYKGDYDMNDVMSFWSRKTVYNVDNKVLRDTICIEPATNFAGKKNGLALWLSEQGMKYTVEHRPAGAGEYVIDETIKAEPLDGGMLFTVVDDVTVRRGDAYRIVIEYVAPVTRPIHKLFVVRGDLEIHLVNEKPTSRMNMAYFGTGSDLSVPARGIYYVSSARYPFAIYLDGARLEELGAILDPANEMKSIDRIFPQYDGWVTSGGSANKDWYKRK